MKILELLTPKRRLGNKGERLTAHYLKKRGYKIRERNYVAAGHEIDLIAENREYVAFVEVKTRTVNGDNPEMRPAAAVTPEKQRKIISAAIYYSKYNQKNKMLRFDIAEVYIQKGRVIKINYMEGAFNLNSARNKRKCYT